MKIALVLSSTPAYSETFFISKIKGLQSKGHEVVLFVQQHQVDFQLCTVKKANKVYRNPVVQGLSSMIVFITLVPYFKRLKKFIQLEKSQQTSTLQLLKKIYLNAHIFKEKVDWLHFGFATMALDKEFVAEALSAKMAVSFRGYDINVYPLKFPNCYDLLWTQVDKVHSISYYLLNKAYQLGLENNTPFEIITPAVAANKLEVDMIALKPEAIKIVTIARLHWMKGLDVAIKAIKLLKDSGMKVEYTIIGSGSKKDTERYLFQIYELGLKSEITLLGSLSHAETMKELSEATIYLQPSLNEGFCNAVLEAQAKGLLTIARDVGGIPENVVDGETGWLVPSRDAEKMAEKIIEIVSLSKDEKNEVRNKAQKRVKEHFNLEKQHLEFQDFYS